MHAESIPSALREESSLTGTVLGTVGFDARQIWTSPLKELHV